MTKDTKTATRFSWRTGSLLVVTAALLVTAAFYLDASVQNWVAQNRNSGLEAFMRAVSRYGDWPSHVGLGLVFCGIAYLRGKKRWLQIFAAMLVACALAGLTTRMIKMSVGRARPHVKTEIRWVGPTFSAKHHAFPSGHSTATTAFFATLLFANWRAGLLCLPIPFLICFSRIYVGAHHFSDVMFGALVGTLAAFAITYFLRLRLARYEATAARG